MQRLRIVCDETYEFFPGTGMVIGFRVGNINNESSGAAAASPGLAAVDDTRRQLCADLPHREPWTLERSGQRRVTQSSPGKDANARIAVEEHDCVSGVQIGIVIIGISITLPLMYSAGELARALGLWRAIAATLIGAAILSLISIPAAVVGTRSRLSSYMIIEHTFGVFGSKLVNIGFGVFLLGWYAVTAELFGRTLYLAAGDLLALELPQWLYTVAASALVIVTTIYGFRAIDRLALFAVPLLLIALLAVVALSLQRVDAGQLLGAPGDGSMDLATGISAVIGAAVVGVVLTPDLTRYARGTRDCVTASLLGQGGGMSIAYIAGMIPVLVWGELEPMSYLAIMGLGTVALGVLVFATWTTNVINLYSTALAARASIPLGNYRQVVVLLGILGTAAAVVGVADHLIDFLLFLGLLVPPVAGIYLADFFLYRRRDYSPGHLAQRPTLRVTALAATLISGGIAVALHFSEASLTRIGAVDSLLLSLLLYSAFERLRRRSSDSGH